jgi:hypothetical protein
MKSSEYCFRPLAGYLMFAQFKQDIVMQLGFKLSNRVTDTLESSSILIYLIQVKGIYTQKGCID